MNKQQVTIYTDGSCLGNGTKSAIGSYAGYVKYNSNEKNKIVKIQKNESQFCKAKGCNSFRVGYSGYCQKHRSLYNSTGSVEQFYISRFDKRIKPYIQKVREYIEANRDKFEDERIWAKRILNNPKSYIKAEYIEKFILESCSIRLGVKINYKTLQMIQHYRYDEIDFLSRVGAVYLFHKENPDYLKAGSGFIFHIGKAIWYGFPLSVKHYKKRVGTYRKRDTITRLQYALLGGVAYTRFGNMVQKLNSLIAKENNISNIVDTHSEVTKKKKVVSLYELKQQQYKNSSTYKLFRGGV